MYCARRLYIDYIYRDLEYAFQHLSALTLMMIGTKLIFLRLFLSSISRTSKKYLKIRVCFSRCKFMSMHYEYAEYLNFEFYETYYDFFLLIFATKSLFKKHFKHLSTTEASIKNN